MAELITSISRSDTIPIVKQLSVSSSKGRITLDVSSFTPRMFYELPAIRFEIYTETNGTRVKYNTSDNVIKTYHPELFPDCDKVAVPIKNIPEDCYIYITPIFDNDAVAARNMLIENGIESGEIWDNALTQTFPITIGFDVEPGGSGGGGGGGSTLTTKTITLDGTYTASDDNADGYSSVTVSTISPAPELPDTYQEVEYLKFDEGYVKINSIPTIGIWKCKASTSRASTSYAQTIIGFYVNDFSDGSSTYQYSVRIHTSNMYAYVYSATDDMTTGYGNVPVTLNEPFEIWSSIVQPSGKSAVGAYSISGNHYYLYGNVYLIEAFAPADPQNYILKTMLKLVPCYRKSDNKVGLYDVVAGTFYAASGTVTAGPDAN